MKVRFKIVACQCVQMEVRPIRNAYTSSSTHKEKYSACLKRLFLLFDVKMSKTFLSFYQTQLNLAFATFNMRITFG